MKRKTVLILGGGIMQIPLIKRALENGYYTIVMDGNPQAPGLEFANLCLSCSIADENKALDVALQCNKRVEIDGVLTVGTDYTRSVSKIGEALGLVTIPYDKILALTNKYLMRTKLRDNHLTQPEFFLIEKKHDVDFGLEYFLEKKIKRLVLKPVDSMGARGVMMVSLERDSLNSYLTRSFQSHQTQIQEAYENALKFSSNQQVIMEEFIDGEEFSIDAIISKGEIQITGVADRIIEHHPYFVETGHCIPSQRSELSIKIVKDIFKKAIRVMGIEDGAAKGDVFVTKDGEGVIGEIAGRLSGGFMSGYTYPLSSGVNLMDIILKISLGETPSVILEENKGVVIEKAIIPPPGEVIAITGKEEVEKLPGVENLFIKTHIGDRISNPENNLTKAGNIIVRGKTYSQAKEILQLALDVFNIKIRSND